MKGKVPFFIHRLQQLIKTRFGCDIKITRDGVHAKPMNLMVCLLLGFFFIFGSYSSYAQSNDKLLYAPAGTPCWAKASPYAKIVFITTKDVQFQATGKEKYCVILRWSIYSRVLLQQFIYRKQKFWLCQNIQINQHRAEDGSLLNISADTILPDILYSLSILGVIILLIFGMNFYRHKFKNEIWVKYKYLWLLSILLLFHYLWAGFFLSKTAQWGHYPQDEMLYFNNIKAFLANGFKSKFSVALGISLYYLPFIYFTNAQSMYDIAPMISWIMVLVIAPAAIAFEFLFVRKITKSVWFAFAAVAIFLLLPKIYLCDENYNFTAFKLFFTKPAVYGFMCYQQILIGFNSMRDMPSTCAMFVLMFLLLKMRVGIWRYIITSALFAVVCHLRTNNIYFAPLVAYIFWHSDKKLLRDYTYTIKMICYSVATFCLVYSPQLLLNKYNNGGFFAYLNTYSSLYGFEFSVIPVNIPYLFNIHYLYYAVFAGACLLIKDRYKRNLLVLWVVPMTIFFCAFRIFHGQPYRYLLTILPGTIVALAVALEELHIKVKKIKNFYLLIFLLLVLVFPVLPIYGLKHSVYAGIALAVIKQYIAPAVSLAVMLWYWKEQAWNCLWAAGIFSILFLSSSAVLLFTILVLLLFGAFFEWGREVWIRVRQRAVPEQACDW